MQTLIEQDYKLPELFDPLPESVIWFKPVMNKDSDVSDFEVGYCNNAACEFLRAPKEALLGKTVLNNSLINDEYKEIVFRQCLDVWLTGKPHEETFHDEFLRRYFNAVRSKILGGVLSTIRDRTEFINAEKQRQEQTLQFTNILNASADGVMILEAIRNKEKEVVDFRITHCNKMAFTLGKLSADCIGKTLVETFPHLKASEQLELHKEVINTGLPVRIETTLRDGKGEEYGWFIVSLMKMGDSVVSTLIDISDKKKNEQKIEEQSDLLKGIFDASINSIFACEAVRNSKGQITDLQIIKINEAFTRMIGLTAAEAEGKSYHSIFPAGKKFGFFDSYCSVIETGENIRKEIFYDDEQLKGWYDVSAVKRGNSGIVITFNNITESKLNKQALQEATTYLQDVIDSSQTGIVLLSPLRNEQNEITDFVFKTVNQTLAVFAGKKPCEMVGELHNQTFPESVTGGLFQKYKEIAEGEKAEQRFEYNYRVRDKEAWLDILVKKRNNDLLITFHDFTPLKKLQVEISSSAEKLTAVVNTSLAGMFTLNPVYDKNGGIEDFRFGMVNRAVAAYIGETPENLIGSLGSIYFPAYKTNGLFDIYKDTYLNNKVHDFDFHYEDGYDIYFQIHTVKVGDEVLVTFTDHTTLKKLQMQLEASIDELRKSNSNLEEFAYAASHDLQEPLRKINYFAERLRKGIGERLSEDESRMFERMESAARRMSQLINDLLTYSQISRNTGSFGAVALQDIIQQVLNDLEASIIEKRATIKVDTLPHIKGDEVQLRQLFQNLFTNSLKYIKKETDPVISINCEVVTKTSNDVIKSYYKIDITDNGIGFEQEHAERIFKVFQRLHGQSEFPGTGIGLAIVQKVVENHHGAITAIGRPGDGATFTILLPKEDKIKN